MQGGLEELSSSTAEGVSKVKERAAVFMKLTLDTWALLITLAAISSSGFSSYCAAILQASKGKEINQLLRKTSVES